VKSDPYRGPPPTEGQFREFLARLIRVPKREIDEREKARKQAGRRRGQPVKVEKEVTEEG
jgi:hypothetical protein